MFKYDLIEIDPPWFYNSRKPDEVYKRIERMYPKLKKISVFARESRAGFDSFGNEVNKFDKREN